MSQDVISLVIDSFWKILLPGLTVTIPLTAVSFALAMVISIAVALIQYRGTPILTPITRFYIWVIRGTPLLVQLFVVFYRDPHQPLDGGDHRLLDQRRSVLRRNGPRGA